MKTRTLAFALAALTLAGIIAWRTFDWQPDQPAQASTATQQLERPLTPVPTFSPVDHPQRERVAIDVVTNSGQVNSMDKALGATNQDSIVVPVAISTEHQELMRLGSQSGKDPFHEMLERELKDPAWAYDMEQKLRLMYESQGAQIYLIECRTTLCEVQSFSNRPRADVHAAPPVPGAITPSLGGAMQVNGRSTELAYFRRDDISRQMELEAQRQLRGDSTRSN